MVVKFLGYVFFVAQEVFFSNGEDLCIYFQIQQEKKGEKILKSDITFQRKVKQKISGARRRKQDPRGPGSHCCCSFWKSPDLPNVVQYANKEANETTSINCLPRNGQDTNLQERCETNHSSRAPGVSSKPSEEQVTSVRHW